MGGKSRKSGGVSKALINRIKEGNSKPAKKCCNNNSKPKTDDQKSLFDITTKERD